MGYYKNLEIEVMQEVKDFITKKYFLHYKNDEKVLEIFVDYKDKKFNVRDLKVKKVLKTFKKL